MKKRIKILITVISICAAAFIAFLIIMATVATDPFKYVTIAFDGARPFLIPKVVASDSAPGYIRASDFTISSEYSRKNRKNIIILADEGQVFTVKYTGKNDLMHKKIIIKRTKLYKVGSTPEYVEKTIDLEGGDRSALRYVEDEGIKIIKETKGYKHSKPSYMGMYTMLNQRYDCDSNIQQIALPAYKVNGKVVLVEFYNLTVDGKNEVQYYKGDCNIVWTFGSLEDVWYSDLLDNTKYDIHMDDSVNYNKIQEQKKKAAEEFKNSRKGRSSGSYSDDYDASDHDDEGYYDDYRDDFSSQDDADDGMEDDYADGDIDYDDY